MARLREIRGLDDVPAFAAAISLLAHLELSDEEAERLLADILGHRGEMLVALGRDPGLRVAAVDFLSNVERRLTNPKIVEFSEFAETERSAVTDALTGLYNRRFFAAAMEREVRRSRRYGLAFSLVMLDLDQFKKVNDAYGHLFGDIVLQRAARVLRRSIREADIACRYGGEEFAVVLPETDRLGAHAVAERIRLRTETAFAERATRGREVSMTVSGGIGCYPEDGQDPGAVITRADRALYLAKGAGRNRIAMYHAERRSSIRYPVKPTARVELLVGSEGAVRPALAVDLSRGGVLVEAAEAYRPEEAVRVFIAESGPRRRAGGWSIAGRVVRVEPGRGNAGRFRMGIAFDVPAPEDCLRTQIDARGAAPRAAESKP